MNKTILKQVKVLQPKLDSLLTTNIKEIEELDRAYEKLAAESSVFDRHWKGQWAAISYNYYEDFMEESYEVVSFDASFIRDWIESNTKIKLADLHKRVAELVKKNNDFRKTFVTEISIIAGNQELEMENELLKSIEDQDWGFKTNDFVKLRKPKQVFVQDPSAVLNKGLSVPPHIQVNAEILSKVSALGAIKVYQDNAKRLLRQLELKLSIDHGDSEMNKKEVDFVYKVINTFHVVSNQLKSRYSNRSTIVIQDEYDVQDLLHSLLKIEFNDVREEEYTPSYAGSSARVDFLLKEQKIVIEVKKTRDGLRDKEVGNQLMLDIVRYKSHPNCKHLICFVYDPESKIQNPRGLENDLNEMSTNELFVEVFIRP